MCWKKGSARKIFSLGGLVWVLSALFLGGAASHLMARPFPLPSFPCSPKVMHDVASLQSSGDGVLLDLMFHAIHQRDWDSLSEVLNIVEQERKSDMDAAIIYALAQGNGLFEDSREFSSASVKSIAEQWRVRSELAHRHAARIFAKHRKWFDATKSESYMWLYFLRNFAAQEVKRDIDQYMAASSEGVSQSLIEGYIAAGERLIACHVHTEN